jgi:hypothetical protein
MRDNLKDLSMFQSAHVRWLKQQLNNLKDIKNRREKPSTIDHEIFAADMELADYIEQLRKNGYRA